MRTINEEEQFDILADELEHEWRTTRPRLTEMQLVEIFSPPREMIEQNLKVWEEKRLDVIRKLKLALNDFSKTEAAEIVYQMMTLSKKAGSNFKRHKVQELSDWLST